MKKTINFKSFIPVSIGIIIGIGIIIIGRWFWCWYLPCRTESIQSTAACCESDLKYEGARVFCCGNTMTNHLTTLPASSGIIINDININRIGFENQLKKQIDGITEFNTYDAIRFEFGLDGNKNLKIILTPASKCGDISKVSSKHFDTTFQEIDESTYNSLITEYLNKFPFFDVSTNTIGITNRKGYFVGIEKLREILKGCISNCDNVQLHFNLHKTYLNGGVLAIHFRGFTESNGNICGSFMYITEDGTGGPDDVLPKIRPYPPN